MKFSFPLRFDKLLLLLHLFNFLVFQLSLLRLLQVLKVPALLKQLQLICRRTLFLLEFASRLLQNHLFALSCLCNQLLFCDTLLFADHLGVLLLPLKNYLSFLVTLF